MTKTMRALALACGVLVAALAATAPASAGVPPGSTGLQFKTTYDEQGTPLTVVIGRVVAQPQKCAKDRKVQLKFDFGSGLEVVDSGRSGDRGYFALAGNPQMGVQRAVLVAPAKKVMAGGERLTCKRATLDVT